MLVSIIIPVYNVAPFLNEALDSVTYQTYEKLEVIIVDDGSTDESGEICDKYAEKDKRFFVIHQANKGLSAARNVGLDNMKGDLVAFLDPDDAYHPDYVMSMVEAIKHKKTDMVICEYTTHYTTGEMKCDGTEKKAPLINTGKYDKFNAFQALYERKLNVSVWNKIYRRELWDDIRFSEGHVFEDNEVAYRIIDHCSSVFVLNRALYLHRKWPGSITETVSVDNTKDNVLARLSVDSFIQSRVPEYFTDEQVRKSKESTINSMISVYCHCSNVSGEWSKYGKDLQKQIAKACQETEICDRRLIIAGWMMKCCPWLLKISYPLYHSIRCIWRDFRRRNM